MNESKYSLCLLKLNEERIKYKYIADRKNFIKCKFDNIKLLIRYLMLGNVSYFFFRLKNKLIGKQPTKYNEPQVTRNVSQDEKVVVFTVLFGNYDTLNDPMYVTPNCEYYVFTNQAEVKSNIWKKFDLSNITIQGFDTFSNLEKARFCKTHPHLFFHKFKYSIFVDANIQIITDIRPLLKILGNNFIAIHKQPGRSCIYQEATEVIVMKKADPIIVKKQICRYKKLGFPKNFGMFQTNVMVREHNKKECINLMNTWWSEMIAYTKRDQLSFTYSLWKNGFNSLDVSVLGENTDLNPRFKISNHL